MNIETAIVARRLNPNVHIVVRSSRQNLNQLLKGQLKNFAALDPVELPAAAFAVAGLGEGTLGLFQISDRKLRVVECTVELDNYRFVRSPAYLLHKKNSRLLSVAELNSDRLFFQWQPDTLIQVGDKVAFIECVENDFASVSHQLKLPTQSNQSHSLALQNIEKLLQKITSLSFWKSKWNQIVF